MARYMHTDVIENGKPMILDRKTDTLLPAEKVEGMTSPDEEIARSRRNIRRSKGLGEEVKLTIGDLSVARKDQREHRVEEGMMRLRNMEKGLSVGDQSFSTRHKDARGLDQLYEGQIPTYPVAHMSPSQEILMEMQAEHRRKKEEVNKIRALIFSQEEEKQARKDAAEARIRRDRAQVEKDVADLLRKR